MKYLRQPTLELLGLGSVLEMFQRGSHPVATDELVDQVFGKASDRGSLVISGANGVVGAGKMVQLGSRLQPYDVPMVGLDFPNAPDGIGAQYPGLEAAFGREQAAEIMSNVVRMSYNGRQLPSQLKGMRPAFLLEAIPEILEIKKAHYAVFREAFPKIEIRSVTSGFPSSELGVGIAHPAFPHQINKIWETVEEKPSAVTQLLWSLGMIPIPVSDNWSFVLDVLFCGLTLSGLRYHRATNMPFWKIDKLVRKLMGPNPFRAHDAIGAAGANFLTWSCLHDLSEKYGPLFEPTPELDYRKTSGQNWYPMDHFRPVVDWRLDDSGQDDFANWIVGPMIQMASLLLHEKRSHLALINMTGEACAQFRKGVLAFIRDMGPEAAIKTVEAYHRLHPEAAAKCWYPEVFETMDDKQWQQLYVNAEHDGTVGVITIGRESYNGDVDAELNRAIDWLKAEGVERVILSGDFHLSTQLVGADTSEFYPALEDAEIGAKIAGNWSATARRLNDDFRVSVGFINGKRCLGGMLELMMHCHYLVAVDDASLGMPEVTLPVVPGMEGCHWPFRKAKSEDWPKLLGMLLTGRQTKAAKAVGWLIDYAGPLEASLATAWKIASDSDASGVAARKLATGALSDIPSVTGLSDSGDPALEAARKAIHDCISESCGCPLSEAISVQAKHSAGFMSSRYCQKGAIGSECAKVMNV
jgi:enoyl-CoA hydratase/carnithine racemase